MIQLRFLSVAGMAGMAACLALLVAGPASAAPIDASRLALVSVTDGLTTHQVDVNLGADPLTGEFAVHLGTTEYPTFIVEDLNLSGNVDPVISGGVNIVNTTDSTQNYVITFILPVSPLSAPTLTGGSTGFTLTDNNGDGATFDDHETNGRPNYYSLIDAGDWVSLSVSPIFAGPFSTNSDAASFGDPIPSMPGPAVNSSIGIEYAFSLTARDRVGVSGVFVVPEPATALLLFLGLVGLAHQRRS